MKKLSKTLAVLTLAAGSLGLTQGALAGDRLTVIYTGSGLHAPTLAHWKYRPYSHWGHHHADRHGHAHSYYHKPWRSHEHRHHDRHEWRDRYRHDDRRSRHDDRGRDRHGKSGRYDSRVSHSAYDRVSRH